MPRDIAPVVEIEHLPIDSLHPDPANPRRISDAELEALTRSIREFGFLDPVIARREDRTVIGGHQRLLAARRLGMQDRPRGARRPHARAGPPPQRRAEQDQRLLGRRAAGAPARRPQAHRRHRPLAHRLRGGRTRQAAAVAGAAREARARRAVRPRRGAGAGDPRAADASPATCGCWGGTGSPAAMPRRPRTWGACWPESAHSSPSRTRPTTSPSATTADSSAARASDASRTTRSRPSSGRPSAAAGRTARRERRRRALRLHEHQGVAARLARAGRGRRALERHDHLGEGPLCPGPRRLPATVRADLVRLARRLRPPLVRRPRPGRRVADRAAL